MYCFDGQSDQVFYGKEKDFTNGIIKNKRELMPLMAGGETVALETGEPLPFRSSSTKYIFKDRFIIKQQ